MQHRCRVFLTQEPPIVPDYDSPWKEMLESYFPDFMAFFFPEAYTDIDWTRGYESLDTELQQIVRDATLGRRRADKLMKVWRRNGTEQMVFIHTEVQGQPQEIFAKRMYVYHYRIFDRYDHPVVSLAILGDRSPTWRPTHYHDGLWGCEVRFQFPMVKLRDYADQWQTLEASRNPFAVVVMAHLQRQATRRDPAGRFQEKLRLLRHLYTRGYSRQQILDLFRFLDWVLTLPTGLEQRLQGELIRLEGEIRMPYITSIERMGIAKGREEGIQQGEVIVLTRLLTRRFGILPDGVVQRLEQASRGDLERWTERLLDVPHLEDLFTSE